MIIVSLPYDGACYDAMVWLKDLLGPAQDGEGPWTMPTVRKDDRNWLVVDFRIRDPRVATLFKLTWCGKTG